MPETTRSTNIVKASRTRSAISCSEPATIGPSTIPSTFVNISASRIGKPQGSRRAYCSAMHARQQAGDDAAAVERQQRDQVKQHEDDVDVDARLADQEHRVGEVVSRQASASFALSAQPSAMTRLAAGPAAATHIMSRLGVRSAW